ncbi:MAG: phosphatidate cytidylyltransferase [Spirochaetaceae bacterium]|nr:MAG: phosphatidate cytidylyltransferase [Spirochaetaceae bacterium]
MQTIARPTKYSLSLPRTGQDVQKELLRKSIHMCIAAVPTIAEIAGVDFTLFLLAAGVLVYSWSEMRRMNGKAVPVISRITQLASRDRDQGHFVLGPVALGIGAMMALLLYPYPAAVLAIYALAFGDGLSSVVGKFFGRVRIPGTGGKTIAGSLTCFAAIFVAGVAVTNDILSAALIALVGTAVEALPVKDFDNILLPMATGLAAQLLVIM